MCEAGERASPAPSSLAFAAGRGNRDMRQENTPNTRRNKIVFGSPVNFSDSRYFRSWNYPLILLLSQCDRSAAALAANTILLS